MASITEQIHDAIEELKGSGINGCITGSSMIPDADFDSWASVPDVDVFVYTEPQLLHASDVLMFKYGYELLDAREDWKFDRVANRGSNKKAFLTTLKLKRGDVVVNITYKNYRNNVVAVLGSFDMSCIMIGYDIPFGWGIDMRTKDIKVFDDRNHRWSDDPNVSVPNPMRKQDADLYTTEMWVRQFARVMKYWDRGIDTRPMARFYVELIDEVIRKGSLFDSDKAMGAFDAFIETYQPLRDKMAAWLEDKEEC